MRLVNQLVLLALATLSCVLAPVSDASAQKPLNAIARLQTGDEMSYQFTLETTETITAVDNPKLAGSITKSKQSVTVSLIVAADTTNGAIVDMTFEGFAVSMDIQERMVEVDLAQPAPPETDPVARSIHDRFKPLIGTRVRINVSKMGAITQITGNDALTNDPAWPVFRRYLDQDLLQSVFGPIFSLKTDGAMPPLSEPWYFRMNIYARGAKSAVWETRTLDNVLGSVATIKGKTDARGAPEEFARRAVQFLDTRADVSYAFDTSRARLVSSDRSDTITTRFQRDATVMNSDLVGRSTLKLLKDLPQTEKNRVKIAPASEPAKPAPQAPPAPPPQVPAAPASPEQ